MQCEGALIEGYANLMLKNYKQAFEVPAKRANKGQKPAPAVCRLDQIQALRVSHGQEGL